MQLGGAPKCVKCEKPAYHTEQAHVLGGVYHKTCLVCVSCSKRLETSNLNENSGNLYCKSCYTKSFGPVGFGHGVYQTVNEKSPIGSPATSVPSATSSQESLGKSPSSSTTTAKKFSIPAGNICPSCSKTVYFAEQIRGPGGALFHKICFKCADCRKTMTPGAESTDKEGKMYCKGCYGKLYGPKGFGYGSTLHTQGASSA